MEGRGLELTESNGGIALVKVFGKPNTVAQSNGWGRASSLRVCLVRNSLRAVAKT